MHNHITTWKGDTLSKQDYLLDASSLRLRKKIPSLVHDLLVDDTDINDPQYGIDVRRRLFRLIDFQGFISEIKDRLDFGQRFVIVDNLDFHYFSEQVRNAMIIGICASLGKPTPTDQVDKKIIWDIKPRNSTIHTHTTFSEHSYEAGFHTDTQFFQEPERYFSLWSVKHASDGGGVTGLVDGRFTKLQMSTEHSRRKILDILSHALLPFRVPSVFTKDQSDDSIEIFMAPIFTCEPFIRYRKDTIQKGVAASKITLDLQLVTALQHLEACLNVPGTATHHLLKSGQVLFGNNHELLHSRTAFTDNHRHLLRVRMAERIAF